MEEAFVKYGDEEKTRLASGWSQRRSRYVKIRIFIGLPVSRVSCVTPETILGHTMLRVFFMFSMTHTGKGDVPATDSGHLPELCFNYKNVV